MGLSHYLDLVTHTLGQGTGTLPISMVGQDGRGEGFGEPLHSSFRNSWGPSLHHIQSGLYAKELEAGGFRSDPSPIEVPTVGDRQLVFGSIKVSQWSKRIPAVEGRPPLTPCIGERGASLHQTVSY